MFPELYKFLLFAGMGIQWFFMGPWHDLAQTNSISPQETVKNFYHWYLHNYYNAGYRIITPQEQLNDGVFQLDTTHYMRIIRKCGYFSKSYIQDQIHQFETCNKELSKMNISEYQECGCSPSELVDHCGFMDFYIWLYHQGEQTEDILVKSTDIDGDEAVVKILLLAVKDNPSTAYQGIKVQLIQENAHWKIKQIDPDF